MRGQSALFLLFAIALFLSPACDDNAGGDPKDEDTTLQNQDTSNNDTTPDDTQNTQDSQTTEDTSAPEDTQTPPDTSTPEDTGQPDVGPPPPIMAGAARVDITPSIPGVPLAGFGGGARRTYDAVKEGLALSPTGCIDLDPSTPEMMFNPNEGLHDPVYAKTVAINDGTQTVIIVSLDLVGVSWEFHEDLSAALASEGIPPQNIMITATHNHSGPGTLSERRFWQLAAMDCFRDDVYNEALSRVIQSAHNAIANMATAKLGIHSGTIDGVQKNRRDVVGVFDNTLSVIHLIAESDDSTIATIVNLPIHPTTQSGSNMLYSSDFVGYLETEIESNVVGTALFINGAEGDVGPLKSQGGWAGTEEVGLKIATRALELIPDAPAYETTTTFKTALLRHDFGDAFLRQGCAYQGEIDMCQWFPDFSGSFPLPAGDWFAEAVPVGVIQIDNTLIVGLPGEPTTRVGYMVRDAIVAEGFNESDIILFGLTNEHAGYITTQEEYNLGGYEAIATMYGEHTATKLVDAAVKTVRTLP